MTIEINNSSVNLSVQGGFLDFHIFKFWYQCIQQYFKQGIKQLLVCSRVLQCVEDLLVPNLAISLSQDGLQRLWSNF